MGYGIQEMQKEVLDPVNYSILNKEASYKGRALGKGMGNFEKFLLTFGVAAPVTYYQSAKAEAKARTGQPLSAGENLIRKYPLLTSIGATVTARSLMKGVSNTWQNSTASRAAGSAPAKNSGKLFPGSGMHKKADVSVDNIDYIYHELIS